VLFEREGRHAGQLVGRSPYLQPVQATAPKSLIGAIAAVTISDIGSNSLFGTLADRVTATAPPAPDDVGRSRSLNAHA
jgi:tRNA-2-methylthio-N6-dimethylallyladenosine synthase